MDITMNSSPISQHVFNRILAIVGPRFLQYVLNTSEELSYNTVIDKYPLTNIQLEVLDDLWGRINHEGFQIHAWDHSSGNYFLRNQRNNGMSLYNHYRKLCGGSLPEIEIGDDLLQLIIGKAIQRYPSLLMRPAFFPQWSGPLSASEFESDLVVAKYLSEILKKYPWTHKLVSSGEFGFLRYAFESGFIIQTFSLSLLDSVIIRSFHTCCYLSKYQFDDLKEQIKIDIKRLRNIGEGKPIMHTTFYGLYGVSFQGDPLKLTTECTLYPISDQFIPIRQVAESISVRTNGETTHVIGAVLGISRWETPIEPPSQSSFTDKKGQDSLSNFMLALIISKVQSSKPLTVTFFDSDLPASNSRPYFHDNWRSGGGCDLKPENIDEFIRWFHKLETTDLSSIQIPVQRLRRAIYEREDPTDSLIDGFIAWEGMFSGTTETTFQVTAAIAKFLKTDHKERLSFQASLKKLYAFRSKLVHGSSNTANSQSQAIELHNKRDEVISIATECLRKLIETPLLLNLNPQERVKYILLS